MTDRIWMDDGLVDYEAATVHVLSPAVKYGALVFEGLRAYWNAKTERMYVVKLGEHLRRFRQTIRAMRFDVSYDDAHLSAIVAEVLRANGIRDDVHMRLAAWVDGTGLYDSPRSNPANVRGLRARVQTAGRQGRDGRRDVLASHPRQRDAAAPQGRGELSQCAARRHGGAGQRLGRSDLPDAGGKGRGGAAGRAS